MTRRRQLVILVLSALLLLGANPQGCEQTLLEIEPGSITVVRDAGAAASTQRDTVVVVLIRRDAPATRITLDPEHKREIKSSLIGGPYTLFLDVTGEQADAWKLDVERIKEQIGNALKGPIDPVAQALLAGELVRLDTELLKVKGESDKPSCDGWVSAGKQVTATVRWSAPTGDAGVWLLECGDSRTGS